MPQKSSFFDSSPGNERYYPAREFAEYFSRFIGNGIFSGGTVLKVSATGADANVSIALGHAWINGYKYTVYDQALSLPIAPATTQDRIDRIVLRLDISTPVSDIQAIVLQGLPGTAPVAPSIVRSGSIYDLSLAQVLVKANTSVVKPENITDERLNSAVCGIVTGLVQQADTTQIFNEFQSWMNNKKAEYQSQWSQFLKDVQDQGFAPVTYVNERITVGNFSPTTNIGNAYSASFDPAGKTLKAGAEYKVLINADSTGAPTFNPDKLGTYPVLKQNQSPAIFKKNGIYTVVFNGTSAFILQGEGGGGNAQPSQVEAGFTFVNDAGEQTGTLSKQAFIDQLVAKGIPASMSDPFNTLPAKIGQIKTGTLITTNYTKRVTSNTIINDVILTIPYGMYFLWAADTEFSMRTSVSGSSSNRQVLANLSLNGTKYNIEQANAVPGQPTATSTFVRLEIDTVNRRVRRDTGQWIAIPSSVNPSNGPLSLGITFEVILPTSSDSGYADVSMIGSGVLF